MSQASDRLWRYLSLTKVLSLLEERALYLARSDKFEDPLEGPYPTEVDPSGEFVRVR
jgi:hypothetical protein